MSWGSEDEAAIAFLIEKKVDEALEDSAQRNESVIAIVQEICERMRMEQKTRENMAQGYLDLISRKQDQIEELMDGGIPERLVENLLTEAAINQHECPECHTGEFITEMADVIECSKCEQAWLKK